MLERKITPEEVKNTVNRGMKWFAKNEGSSGRWHANMAGIEVVFERVGSEILVVTVY